MRREGRSRPPCDLLGKYSINEEYHGHTLMVFIFLSLIFVQHSIQSLPLFAAQDYPRVVPFTEDQLCVSHRSTLI